MVAKEREGAAEISTQVEMGQGAVEAKERAVEADILMPVEMVVEAKEREGAAEISMSEPEEYMVVEEMGQGDVDAKEQEEAAEISTSVHMVVEEMAQGAVEETEMAKMG